MKSKKREIISFDELFYVKKSAHLESDVLFESAVKELHLDNAFEYQMSVFKEGENAHIFLTHIKNLEQKESAYPQPLIFSALAPKFIQEKKFCVVFFGENFSFVSFFKNAHFVGLRNLPQFSLRDLNLKENKEDFFQNYGILELLSQNDLIISVNDTFGFGVWLGKFQKHLSLESVLKEEVETTLCSLCHFSGEVDFIKKNELNLKPLIVAFALFSLCFFGTLGVLFIKDYPKYTQNKITQQQNANLQADLARLNENFIILDEKIKDLNRTHKNNTLLLTQNEELLRNLSAHFKPNQEEIRKIYNMFHFLNQNTLKISFFHLNQNQIKVIFNTELDYFKALEKLEKEGKFKILNFDSKKLTLELSSE